MSVNKLLLADDSITIQKVVQLTFVDEGIDVSIAPDGDMALLKFAEDLPDIVLADVHMPGLNGYEVCERIKQGDRKVPVVLLVGSFEPFDTDRAHQVGADAFLTKPFQSIRQLVDIVSNLLAADDGGKVAGHVTAPSVADRETDEFAATYEMPRHIEMVELGDSGMDDEMIETVPAASFLAPPAPESPQHTAEHEFHDTLPMADAAETSEREAPVDDFHAVSDPGKSEYETGPLTFAADETPEFGIEEPQAGESLAADSAAASAFAGFEKVHSFEIVPDTPPDLADYDTDPDMSHGFAIVPEPPRYSPPVYAPVMDDANFLEIPSAGAAAPVGETVEEHVLEDDPSTVSPEFVEAVAQRVMEKMNDDFFKNLIRELVPDVVREFAEGKMGE